ncbi:hypothetical protein D9M70_611430 [compost metagenome]
MLEQPAAHQAFPGARGIEQVFPLHHLQGFPGAGSQGLLIDGSACGQPALQGLVLLVGQAGDGQGHAFLGMAACVFVELIRHRAAVFTIEA